MKLLPYDQYQCEVCGHTYPSRRLAEFCEKGGPVSGDIKVGDIIDILPNTFFHQPGIANRHEVRDIRISQGFSYIQKGHIRLPIIRHSRFGDVFLLLSEFELVLAKEVQPKFERAVRI